MRSINMWASDSTEIYSHAIVDSMGTILLNNNETARTFFVTPIDFYNLFGNGGIPFFIVEGVGAATGFVYPFVRVFENYAQLGCVKEDGVNLYNGNYLEIGVGLGSSCGLILSTNDKEEEFISFELYPNPANGESITIDGEGLNLFELYNIQGQLIKTVEVKNDKVTIDLNKQPKGIYFVKAQFKNGVVTTKKLIIN